MKPDCPHEVPHEFWILQKGALVVVVVDAVVFVVQHLNVKEL
jgi:hypothetical protein